MAQPRIIILDDQDGQQIGNQIKAILDRENSYRLDLISGTSLDVKGALEAPPPDLIIPVLLCAKEQPEKVVAKLRALHVHTPLLPVMRAEDLDKALDRLLIQTKDFLVMPLRESEVCARVRRFIPSSGDREIDKVKQQMADAFGLARLIGEDPGFMAMKRKIPLIAAFESTVLLTGETGTGKELCARALHYLSARAEKPFLPVNCGAIPLELFESELFGYHKGAFTSAFATQPGLIAEAEGGTLFLDEVETLSLVGQGKLLRFIQDQSYYALGSHKPKKANVWIIASTNVDLQHKAIEGSFRQDLLYRLSVITLELPPLRHRLSDVPLLAEHFLRLYVKSSESSSKRLSPRAMEALCQYSWPGNVRELENVVRQLIVLTESTVIEPENLPIALSPTLGTRTESLKECKARAIEQFERTYVSTLLRVHHGNVTQAAKDAHKERRAFGRLIKKYKIERLDV